MGRRRRPAVDLVGDQACSMPSSCWVEPITIGPSVDCPRVGTRPVLGSCRDGPPRGSVPLVLLLGPRAGQGSTGESSCEHRIRHPLPLGGGRTNGGAAV